MVQVQSRVTSLLVTGRSALSTLKACAAASSAAGVQHALHLLLGCCRASPELCEAAALSGLAQVTPHTCRTSLQLNHHT